MAAENNWGTNTLLENFQLAIAEVRSRWKLVILVPALIIVLAVISVLLTPRLWFGDVLLEVGQVTAVPPTVGVQNPAAGLIEPLAAVASLVQSPPFKSTVAKQLGLDPESPNAAVINIYESLEARIPPGVAFVRIHFTSADAEFNRRVVDKAAQLVIDRHTELVKQRRAAIEQQLKWVTGELEAQEKLAQQALAVPDAKGQDPVTAFLAASLREQLASRLLGRLWELRRDHATIQASFNSTTFSETRISSPSLVKRLPRGGAMVVATAAVGGLAFAVVLVLLGVGRSSRQPDPGREPGTRGHDAVPSA